MKFRIWLIYNQIAKKAKSIYNSKLLHWIRNNLLFALFINIIIMTCFVFGIIRFLFLFSPSKANLHFSDEVTSLEFTASSVSCTLETDHIGLLIENECKIQLDGLCIKYDGKEYDNIDYFSLHMDAESTFALFGIKRNDNSPTSAFLTDPELLGIEGSVRCFNKDIILNNGMIVGGFEDGEYKVWITGAKVKAYDSSDKEIFDADTFTLILNEKLYGISSITTCGKTSLITPNIMRKYNESPVTNHYSASFEGVTDVTFVGSGELFFSLTTSPKTYNIHNQTVSSHGILNELTAFLELTEGSPEDALTLTVSGIVDESYISDMTLFPSFSVWYTDNIYLTPLSLVSIVFGSISLLKKKQGK